VEKAVAPDLRAAAFVLDVVVGLEDAQQAVEPAVLQIPSVVLQVRALRVPKLLNQEAFPLWGATPLSSNRTKQSNVEPWLQTLALGNRKRRAKANGNGKCYVVLPTEDCTANKNGLCEKSTNAERTIKPMPEKLLAII
jgi:hypothetical protein